MDFERAKKAYDSMSWQEQKKFAEQNKNNPEFQQFANQYLGGNKQTPPQTQPNPAPVENNAQNQTSPNGQNWENGGGNQQTSPFPQPSYDPNEQFDSSSFNNPNAQVQVQAGNAKQTGMPDYQDDSDARMGEITNNLNAYWNTNREYFSDRQTFNKVFSYDKRSEAQQAHFDSFRKRKEIDQKVAGYADGKSVSLALEEGTLTKAQLEALKVQNPKVYTEYLEDQLNKKNLDLVNTGSKSRIFNEDEQISHNTDALTDMMRKLGFDMSADGRAKELYEKFKELKNDPKIDDMKQDYLEARKIYLQRRREFNTLPERIRAQSTGASETLISARISKAQRLAYNELQTLADEAQIRKEEYVLEYGEMKDEFNAFKMQADEEYRAFTSKMTALGFAKGILAFETPEQQRQGQLRQLEAQNQLTLQFEKDKIALQSELNDINSKDPKIQFNAVMKALDPHYKEFGSIILRPQAQAAQDIINLAKKEGISVGEAMRKNFTEPLQKKDGYKMLMNKNYGISNEPKDPKIVNIGGIDYQYDSTTGEYRLPQLSNGTSFTDYQMKGRANRHNNPTAMTTDVARDLGMKKGVDYIVGDSFGGGKYYTAKLLGNGIETTLNAFDKTANDPNRKIFYNQSGKQRWTYLAMSDEEWLSLSQEEKIGIIQRMYNNEEKRDRRNFGAFGYSSSGQSNGNYNPTRTGLYDKYLTSNKTPNKDKLKQMGVDEDTFIAQAEAYSQQTGYTPLTDTQFTQSNQVINSFKSDPQVKAFEEAYTNSLSLLSSLDDKSGPGDVAAIFAFMKSLDPKSVVRESEFETAARSSGVFAYIGNSYDRLMKGEKLTNTQRMAFGKLAKQFVLDRAKTYDIKYQDGLRRLQMQGIPVEVFPKSIADEMRATLGVSFIYADIATSLLNESGTGAGSVASFDSNNPLSYIAGN